MTRWRGYLRGLGTGSRAGPARPHRQLLAGLLTLASGAACAQSNELFERETSLPPEQVAPATCAVEACLIVEENSIYCSVDPYQLREGAIFASKSRLQIRPGTYPLSEEHALSELAVTIETPSGERTFASPRQVMYSLHREEFDPETRVEPLVWIEVRATYGNGRAAIRELFMRTSRWPHAQFRLGDPQDARWFFEAARRLSIRVMQGWDLFPGIAGTTIRLAPCTMRGISDQPFEFRFEDGSVLKLTARVISGSHQVGYYVGRLMEAQGHWAKRPVHVQNRNDLALFGSTWSQGETTLPTFAVRTAAKDEVCGLILDVSQWDTDMAVDGYVAYELTCDERRGRRLPLTSVSYPDVFALP